MSMRYKNLATELTIVLIAVGVGAGSGCASETPSSGAAEQESPLATQDLNQRRDDSHGDSEEDDFDGEDEKHSKEQDFDDEEDDDDEDSDEDSDEHGDSDDEGFGVFEDIDDEDDEQELDLSYAKLLIEHNATDEDTGFQLATDGEPWNGLDIVGPDGEYVLSVRARGSMRDVGLTEMFFETQEPPNAEVPIPKWLANLPEGTYEFEGRTVDGIDIEGEATLTHAIPAGPRIVAPEEEATVSPDEDLSIVWEPVSETIYGEPVAVTHYQLIVEEDVEFDHPGFGRALYSVHVPANITSLRVPHEFLAPSAAYAFEVLAIEKSGNQTLVSREFETSE